MKRDMLLAGQWYPNDKMEIFDLFTTWACSCGDARSVVAPHAGWRYSGELAFCALSQLSSEAETIVIAGGHLPKHSKPVLLDYTYFSTPLGDIPVNMDILSWYKSNFDYVTENQADNCVEIFLPMIKYLFPKARIFALRLPPDQIAFDLANAIIENFDTNKIVTIGSTDLTHYGPRFSFTSHGTGSQAVEWVEKVNDAEILRLLADLELEDAIEHALTHYSACSVGAAVFAALMGQNKGQVVSYSSSAYSSRDENFVGYGVVSY